MNNNKYSHLTSPIQLGKVTFRNRIFSAPMGATDITADCCPGPRTQGFYEHITQLWIFRLLVYSFSFPDTPSRRL